MSGGTRFIYVAHPIDQRGDDERAHLWPTLARKAALKVSLGTYAPGRAFNVPDGGEASTYIERVNRSALAQSSGVLALLPKGVPSIGVPMEIEAAWQQGIPVAVVTDGPTWSLVGREGIQIVEVVNDDVETALWAAAEWLVRCNYVRENRRDPLPFTVEAGAHLPTRHYDDDAGLDLHVSEAVTIPVGQFRDVPCGVAVQMESWNWGLIIGRSSTLRNRGLMVAPGVIDPGYRGELFSGCYNMGPHAQTLQAGERVAQFILMGNATQAKTPVAVTALRPSARGSAGFGSTGT